MPSSYKEIADLTSQMVKNGEMTPAEEFQVHQLLSQKGYGPGVSTPQPAALAPTAAPQREGLPNAVGMDLGAALQPISDYSKAGWNRVVNAIPALSRPGVDAKLQAASDIVRGAGQAVAPIAVPLAGAAAGPVALGTGLAGGLVGGTVAGAGARALGAGPGAQSIAEDAGGFAGGSGLSALASQAAPTVGGLLQDAAKTQYSRVLNATTKANKATSAKIVPELLDRGVTAATAKGLLGKFKDNQATAGQSIEDLWSNIPQDATIPLSPILNTMNDQASASFRSPSGLPLSDQAENGLRIVRGLGLRLVKESTVDPQTGQPVIAAHTLRRYRQDWDRITNKANGFTSNLDDSTVGGAHNIGGDAARAGTNGQYPDVDAANQEYGLWKDASRVMGDTMQRRQGQAVPLGRKLARYVGMGAGYAVGGAPGAAATGAALNGLETAGASVPWNTNMAVAKYGLGGLLQQQQPTPYWIPGLLGATQMR